MNTRTLNKKTYIGRDGEGYRWYVHQINNDELWIAVGVSRRRQTHVWRNKRELRTWGTPEAARRWIRRYKLQ